MSINYKFDLTDIWTPDKVIDDAIKSIEVDTKGYVTAHLESYSGHIFSYKTTTQSSLAVMSNIMSPKTVEVNIQDRLGEQGNEEHKYELFLSVKGIEKYKYRILFVRFGTITYPVTVVLNEDIANDIFNNFTYLKDVNSMKELQDLMEKVLSSHSLTIVIQNLINEALRQEKRGILQTTNAPGTVNE